MQASDIAVIITAATGLATAVGGVVILFQKKSRELSAEEELALEDCSAFKRLALRIIRQLREILAEAGIPEPEGIDDQLQVGRRRADRSPPEVE